MIGISLRVTSETVPLLIEGYVYGKYVRFRERSGAWSFHIGRPDDVEGGLVEEGECPEFLDPTTAMGLIKTLIYAHMGINLFRYKSRDILPY